MPTNTDIIESAIREKIELKSLFNNILNNDAIAVKGLTGSLKSLVLSRWIQDIQKPILIVVKDQDEAETLYEEMDMLVGPIAAFLPGGDIDRESPVILNPRRMGLQMMVVRDVLAGSVRAVITSAEGLAHRFPPPPLVEATSVQLSAGSQTDMQKLVVTLIQFGYTREHLVERPGEISLRGGILDVFPFTGEDPHRIEFFGDVIESMRTFDVDTQISENRVESLILASSPIMWENPTETIAAYFSEKPVLFIEDPDLVYGAVDEAFHAGHAGLFETRLLRQLLKDFKTVSYYSLSAPKGAIDFGGRDLKPLGRIPSDMRNQLARKALDSRVVILCRQAEQRDRILDLFDFIDDPVQNIHVMIGYLQRGFDLPEGRLTVYTEHDLFGRIYRRRRKKGFREGVPIRELSALKKGDYVVHIDHGIGIYQGLEKISVQHVDRECLAIQYQDKDMLFVPVDKMERVQKYAARDGASPNLSKLGSQHWEKLKEKTKKSIQNIAKDLIALYSARQARTGHSFSEDTTWQREMEAAFAFEETPDQETTISEVKTDMEKPAPMDRLICGDVGYGKTEVAVRAAFKAVNDGKQVAVLVPTTILAQQHLTTFRERLDRFPITIEMLSRFKTSGEQKQIVANLKKGDVDIVIGTHRLLSKDVGFKDLGLLVIDEEHRFGVRHKEKLKSYRETVDVLAMTATPIPRTLHFSLMKIRDMSVMNTPPKDRLPIITEVAPFDEAIIGEAIERELSRGGQIFFVHNRVRSIYAIAAMIQRLVPGIRLGVAHGQMPERELERVMVRFLKGELDCLVATMIIESGLDMPHVNTLIIHRADQLGLAQLYQLRGRVGRSDRRAYAYLLTPPFHTLTPEALKRLRTIEEFTELGSGFQIAMRDMEIRGAGNLLGTQQSGYMDAVGYDLYKKLVEEAVEELQSESDMEKDSGPPEESSCRVDIDLPAYFSETYVGDASLRINLYRRLSALNSIGQVDNFENELLDRFGPLPAEAGCLLNVTRLRLLGNNRELYRITIEGSHIQIWFRDSWLEQHKSSELFNEHLRIIMESSPYPIQFLQDKHFGFEVSLPEGDALSFIKKLLQRWG